MHIQQMIPFENELHDSVFRNNLPRGAAIYRTSLLLNYLSLFPVDELPYTDALYGQALFRKWKTVLSHRYGYQYLNDLIFPADWNRARTSDDPDSLVKIMLEEAVPYLQRLREIFGVPILDLTTQPFQRPSTTSSLRLISEFVARTESEVDTPEDQPHFEDAIALHQIVTRYYFNRQYYQASTNRLEEFGLFILPSTDLQYLKTGDHYFSATGNTSFRCLAIASRWQIASLTEVKLASSSSKNTAFWGRTGQSNLESMVELDPTLFVFIPKHMNLFTNDFGEGWAWSITPISEVSETNEIVLNENELPPHWTSELIMFTLGQESMRRTDETMDLIDYALAA